MITVITVSFNAAAEIEKTIQSVLAQSYNGIEYIIVDGGSKDGTKEIIEKYNDRISKWVSEPDKGLYDAMNKGVSMATGEWVCFMNAGDEFENDNVIERVFEGSSYNNTSVIYGDVALDYSPYGYVIKSMKELKGRDVSTEICHQATFTRRKCLLDTPFDLSFKIYGDLNMFHSLWKKGLKFEYTPTIIAIFEAFDGISSLHPERNFHERNRMLNRHWFNSMSWWKSALMLLLKKISMKLQNEETFKKKKFERILKQNCEYRRSV